MQDVLITGPRKKKPKLLAYVDKGKCFGRGCEMCIHVCPVKDCIYLVPDPEPGSMILLGTGLVALASRMRRKTAA